MTTTMRVLGLVALAAALGVGYLLSVDTDLPVGVKVLQVFMRPTIFFCALFNVSPFPTLNRFVPSAPAGVGSDGVTSVDLVIPAAPSSVFPGITPLEDIGVRVYYPTAGNGGKKMPILVYFHGGGFVMFSAYGANVDEVVRRFAVDGPFLVVSVDYRLAPQYTLPAPMDDAIAAMLWVHAGTDPLLQQYGDTSRVIVMGDSVGGTLAALTTQLLVMHHPQVKVAYQVLLYPLLEPVEGVSTASRTKFKDGWVLFQDSVDLFQVAYLPKNETLRKSHINHPQIYDNFAALPPGQVVVGELDMLHDEGVEYYNKLKQAGVDVVLRDYPHAFHGFFTVPYTVFPAAEQAYHDVLASMRPIVDSQ